MSYGYNQYNLENFSSSTERQLNNNKRLRYATNKRKSSSSIRYHRRNNRRTSLRKLVFITGVVAIFAICATLLVTALGKPDSTSDKSHAKSVTAVTEPTETEPTKIVYNTTNKTVDIPKDNNAEYAIIVDKSNNTIVAERNAHQRTYPASTTKIMTLLVAVENIKDMNDTFRMTLEITDPLFRAEASVAGFKNGEKITMTDLLYGTILPSGADAAMGLAIKVAGSEENFVKLMNDKVKELGLENTHFANVTGLHDKNNYSSAYDMAIILDAALQNPLCQKVLSTYQHTTEKTKQNPKGILLSSTLFNYMYGTEPETATIMGGKTGYVTEAGYCLASYGEANESGKRYIVVTFKNSGLWPAMHGQIALYKKFAK